MNTKQIGEITEACILAILLKAGYVVLTPFGDNQRYDLVIERDGVFQRVQCKSSSVGSCGHAGRCGFCHGKKIVTSEFVKWNRSRKHKEIVLVDFLKEQSKKQVRLALIEWENRNPRPRKFMPKK